MLSNMSHLCVDSNGLQAVVVGGADDSACNLSSVAHHDPRRGLLVAVG
jgi:hypothetical protein